VGAKLDMSNLCEYLGRERFGDRVFKVGQRERGGRGRLGKRERREREAGTESDRHRERERDREGERQRGRDRVRESVYL
jgi:hypothetical protein